MKTLLIVLLFAASASSAAPVEQCPSELPIGSVSVLAPRGWQGVVSERWLLTRAEISLGNPKEKALLIPQRREYKQGYDEVYGHLNSVHKDDVPWLACHYGLGGEAMLAHPLRQGLQQCVVKYRKNEFNMYDVKVNCE